MKHVLLLLITLILSSTAFSQTGTDTSKISIPTWVAKQIALDLTSGDSIKEELIVTKTVLEYTEKKVVLQDSLVSGITNKNKLYAQQILLYKDKEHQYIKYTKDLQKENKSLKFKNKLTLGFGILAVFGSSLILYSTTK